MKNWLVGVFGAIAGSLIVAWVTGAWNPTETIVKKLSGSAYQVEEYKKARAIAKNYYFYANGDGPWEDAHKIGFPNKFTSSSNSIIDSSTGLTWQQNGSNESLGYSEIAAYLRELNEKNVNGYNDWRLPTLTEAWSLLEFKKNQNGLSIEKIFDSKQTWIWTETTTNDGYGWFIFFKGGKPIFQNANGSHAYIRAVRGEKFE